MKFCSGIVFIYKYTLKIIFFYIFVIFILVATDAIPNICNVKTYEKTYWEDSDDKHGSCKSTEKYIQTGCSGLCKSEVMAQLGHTMFTPTCQCCQPVNVTLHNVTMVCADNHTYQTNFHEIKDCTCRVQTCQSSYNTGSVNVITTEGSSVKDKRSLFERLDELGSIDPLTVQRHRRTLLNDLALVHARKMKKR